ncbi:hypothetical protein [Caudoviricetes sp.]|nr:hypothetical protein [Caudoviricetes sp.]
MWKGITMSELEDFYQEHLELLRSTKINKYGNWSYSHDPFYSVIRKPKFEVGQIVDFVNDYGVVFPNRRVLKVVHPILNDCLIKGEPCYELEGSDCPWFPSRERNLRATL